MTNRVLVFDTNIVSNIRPVMNSVLSRQMELNKDNTLCLCEPVVFEVERGYEHRQASRQMKRFREQTIPLFTIVTVQLADWRLAATLWGDLRRRGRQMSDVDVLLAAITLRLKGILITDDADFMHLPIVRTENWLIDGMGHSENLPIIVEIPRVTT
jgi:predicted nucleic acid-binding protein